MKTRLHKKQQNCSKLLTLFTMGIALLTGVVAMGLCTIRESYHQARAVTYYDEDSEIDFNVDELNNYTFDNFNSVICSIFVDDNYNGDLWGANPFYNDDTYSFDSDDCYQGTYHVVFYGDTDSSLFFGFNVFEQDNNKFYCGDENDEDYSSFIGDVSLVFNASYYDDIKQAIEQDILANQPNPSQPMLDFVSIIVSGIGAFASGVASGVSDFASALFLDIEGGQVVGLSVFGGILAIFVGLALAVGITIKVYNWITSLGN